MPVSQRFCGQCGTPQSNRAVFCASCGNRLGALAAAPQPSLVQPQTPMPSLPSASVGGETPQMPAPVQKWQVLVGDQLPVITPPSPPGAATVAPAPSRPPARSLRAPVVWTTLATCTDLAAAYATANPAAMATMNYRAGFAGVSLIAGLIAGRRRGLASVIVILGTLGLSLFEGMTLWGAAQQILTSPQLAAGMLPNAIPQALAMLSSLRTALSALRRT
jgi:hypothetical protein